jgi:hypothetical protein
LPCICGPASAPRSRRRRWVCLRIEDELWGTEVAPLGVGPLIEIDTTEPVDVVALARLIHAAVEPRDR